MCANPPLFSCELAPCCGRRATDERRSTMWYTREEQALVIGSFYSMNGFQQCVGGLIAYGIAQITDAKIKNWQILFTVRGLRFPALSSISNQSISYSVASRSYGVSSSDSGSQIVPCGPSALPPKIAFLLQNASGKMIPDCRTRSSK